MRRGEESIQRKLQEVMATYGSDIDLLKFATQPTDLYRQGAPTFSAAVSVRGRGIRHPTKDQVSVIGDGEEVEIAFLFSRLDMIEAFPDAAEGEWIDNRDEVGFEGVRYRILSTHLTGRVASQHALVVLIGATKKGTAGNGYP